jgi:ligand-binding SRPBCC domain-containing protein
MAAEIEKVAGAGSEIAVSFFLLPYVPVTNSWTARVVEFEWNRYFRDIQVKGPFKQFDHAHSFEQADRNGHSGTLIRDTVRYDLGFGGMGKLLNVSIVRMQLSAMFRYRQRATERLLTRDVNALL